MAAVTSDANQEYLPITSFGHLLTYFLYKWTTHLSGFTMFSYPRQLLPWLCDDAILQHNSFSAKDVNFSLVLSTKLPIEKNGALCVLRHFEAKSTCRINKLKCLPTCEGHLHPTVPSTTESLLRLLILVLPVWHWLPIQYVFEFSFANQWNLGILYISDFGKCPTLANHSLLELFAIQRKSDKAYLVDTRDRLSSLFHGQTYWTKNRVPGRIMYKVIFGHNSKVFLFSLFQR